MAFLWWVMLAVSTIISVAVFVLMLVAIRRRPSARTVDDPGLAAPGGHHWALIGGVVMPVIVLIGIYVLTVRGLAALAAPPTPPAVVVEVTGRQFWWEVHYPDQGFTTANEIHIPAGEPVEFRLAADTVIHSFWVPRLHGKLDMIPGRVNSIWMRADGPGVFRGQCAEFCGVQHARMVFLIIAEPRPEFERWVANQRRPPGEPPMPQAHAGRALFMTLTCKTCHTIKGTEANGTIGPDLTHVGSRQTLAAGTLPNTAEDLARFIDRPQEIKPGNHMPVLRLDPEAIDAITAYLAALD
jgi:cytochrome c oxidase subunit 2